MLNKKSIGIAFAAVLALGASGVASATMVTVGGVTWDTDSPIDLNIGSLNLFETTITGENQTLTGFGQVNTINSSTSFCAGCDLSFQFTYNVQYLGPTVDNHTQAIFNLGSISFYTNPAGTFNINDPSSAGPGTLWLTLTGHTGVVGGFPVGMTGELFSNINGVASNPLTGSNGQGWLDATGGPAAAYMQTHTQADGLGGFADFSINSHFLFQLPDGCSSISSDPNSICHYPINGGATLIGNSMLPVSVPEPAELGLLGLGLGFLGFLIRRRRKEAEDLS